MARTATDHKTVLRSLLEGSATGDPERLGAAVTDDVTGWSPNLLVVSRQELLEALEDRQDALSNVETTVDALYEVGDTAVAEWHVVADHTGPFVIDDEAVVEATGRQLHLAGATFAEFDGDRICAFRHYFDDLALLEQVLGG